MKKIIGLGMLALAGVAVVSCANTNGDTVAVKDIIGLDDKQEVAKLGEVELLFKRNSEVPYISLTDGVEMMSQVRVANLDDTKYKCTLNKENDNYVITNESGAKCTLSAKNQTLAFDDFDKFTSIVSEGQKPITILPVKAKDKHLKIVSSEYKPGKEVVMDLKPYSALDIYESNGKCYIPLSIYNSALFNIYLGASYAYNGKEVFFFVGNQITDSSFVLPIETELGGRFRKDAIKSSVSKEYVDYYYQSLCFDFNYDYGLKEKFTSFENYLTSKGYVDNLHSTDPRTLDLTTLYALSNLNDGHTALNEFSNLYPYRDVDVDNSKLNPTKVALDKDDENYVEKHKNAGIKEGIEYVGQTAFVTFKEFNKIDPDLLYGTKTDKSDDLDDIEGLGFGAASILNDDVNTAKLFNKLYKEVTGDVQKLITKYIVVDLTANNGGDADALLYALSVLIGDVSIDMHNPLTGGHNHLVYKADINADGVIDDKDKSLSELGFKIYFLDSKYSFSSANAMPVLAKLNKPSVVTLGAKTAGGPCAVRSNVTPIGSIIYSSSLNTITKLVNGNYQNIDDGVEADFALTEDQMVNRAYIANNIEKWVK